MHDVMYMYTYNNNHIIVYVYIVPTCIYPHSMDKPVLYPCTSS